MPPTFLPRRRLLPFPRLRGLRRMSDLPKFTGSDRFLHARRKVDAYFEESGLPRRDCPKMYFKTATILGWFFGAYLLLLFAVHRFHLVDGVAVGDHHGTWLGGHWF